MEQPTSTEETPEQIIGYYDRDGNPILEPTFISED